MSTATATEKPAFDPYAPKTIVRETRQIARCSRCKTTRSRLVTRTTRVTYYGRPFPKRHAHSVDTIDGKTPTGHAGLCGCNREIYFRDVKGVTNPDHNCDARCLSATGHNCECACGGRNHGASHA